MHPRLGKQLRKLLDAVYPSDVHADIRKRLRLDFFMQDHHDFVHVVFGLRQQALPIQDHLVAPLRELDIRDVEQAAAVGVMH